MGIAPIPDDSPLAQNPLVAMVADYDSAASKKAKSKGYSGHLRRQKSRLHADSDEDDAAPVMKAKPFGATPVSATGNDVTTPPAAGRRRRRWKETSCC